MSTLRIHLFGKFDICCGEQALTGFDARKMQELFCYLVLHRERPCPREILATLLWGDNSTAQSKRYLRKALWQLQTVVNSQTGFDNGYLFLIEPDWVQFNPRANFWLDVAVFERVFIFIQGVPGREFDSQRTQTVQGAIDLYRGDLLEGWHQDWCVYERERFRNMYLVMLDKLMGHCEASRDCENGLFYGSLILRYEKARERTYRRLMRLHYLAGDRTAALRQYERCVAVLDEELGVIPGKRTRALYEQLRSDCFGDAVPSPIWVDETADFSLLEVLGHLKQLQGVLADAQRQVQRDVQAVERALHNVR
jgi:DNA-binding SARP family transcriptional activator